VETYEAVGLVVLVSLILGLAAPALVRHAPAGIQVSPGVPLGFGFPIGLEQKVVYSAALPSSLRELRIRVIDGFVKLEGTTGQARVKIISYTGFFAQGGKIREVKALMGGEWHVIVGRAIYRSENMREAVRKISQSKSAVYSICWRNCSLSFTPRRYRGNICY